MNNYIFFLVMTKKHPLWMIIICCQCFMKDRKWDPGVLAGQKCGIPFVFVGRLACQLLFISHIALQYITDVYRHVVKICE